MEIATFLAPLLSAVAATVASLIKDRSVRTFENRTKRIQCWKTMLDACSLSDVSAADTITIKEELRREITEATTEIVLKHKKFLGTVAILPTFGFVWIVAILLSQLSLLTENRSILEGAPKDQVTAFAIAWTILEIGALFFTGFRCQNFLKRWLWEQIKPGGPWQRVSENRQLQGLVRLGAVFACLALVWVSRDLMAAIQ